jgi:hypothetical protein
MAASWPYALLLVGAASGVAACSLIDSFADLKPATDAGAADSTSIESGGGETGSGDAPPGDSSAESNPSEGGPDGGFPDKGIIVVSGRVSDDAGNLTGVLTAIDPTDGHELPDARQALNVPVVLYDGQRDLWYVIETDGTSLFPTPTDHAVLHIRTLDPVTGTWTTLQSVQIPPPVFGLAAAITNRLVYVGYDAATDAGSGTSFVTIDTSTPSAPNIYGLTGLPVTPFGLLATRSQTGNGGPVNMLLAQPCPSDAGGPTVDGGDAGGGIGGGECMTIQHVTVPTDPDPATLEFEAALGPFFGRPAFGSYLTGAVDVIGWSLPGGNPGSPGTTAIHTYSPQNFATVGTPISIQTSDGFFQPFAFAECQQQAILTATNEDLAVYAIPLASASATLARAATTHSGQSVYFEPYTSTVLSPFTQGDGFVLNAFTLGGTPSNPTLTQRQTGWTPPADVRPEVLAIRAPVPVKCPP